MASKSHFRYIAPVKAEAIKQAVQTLRPPFNIYTSDGRAVYVDHPELIMVTAEVVAVGSGAEAKSNVAKQIILLATDHIVRLEPAPRRPLQRKHD